MNMKVIQINSCNFGSTGNIMLNLAKVAREKGHIVYTSCPDGRSMRKKELADHIYIGNILERNVHIQLSRYTGYNGCFSKNGTKKFLHKIDVLQPDIIHLHNLHNCYINLEMLFDYIKYKRIPVVWTLHDCWAFTGQCPYFSIINCDKWQTGCYGCSQYKQYPESKVDRTQKMYMLKKEWFTGVEDLIIITPSQWLADRVSESFLKNYPVKVINNGIDLDLFKPTQSDFREKYGLQGKIVLLGVASGWSKRKGLNIFIELSKLLNEKYKIVLVGLSTEQINNLPDNIIGLSLLTKPRQLAEIFSAVDWFINPSMEETMGLVTAEALACGTPAIVSNLTAVPEVIDNNCGIIVDQYSADVFAEIIEKSNQNLSQINCLNRAKEFDMWTKFMQYMDVYNSLNINARFRSI